MLGENIKVTEALAYASGTADRDGAIIDMAGFDGVLILCHSAAVHNSATYRIAAVSGANSGLTDAAVLDGSQITIGGTEDDEIHWIDVKPIERYVRVKVFKDGANACAESVAYIQYGPSGANTMPVTDADGVAVYEPDES